MRWRGSNFEKWWVAGNKLGSGAGMNVSGVQPSMPTTLVWLLVDCGSANHGNGIVLGIHGNDGQKPY
eukprot:scaffold1724_cov341-Pavlova_lutheri.AAC.53